jgi:glycosyltransferase involved in cell wall biosynthesis
MIVMPVATQRGGAEATLLDLLRHSRGEVRWLVAFLEDGPMLREAESLDAATVLIPAGRVRELHRAVSVIRRLGAAMRSWRSDAVVSWMSKAHLYTAPAARALGVPALWFQHGLPSPTDPIDRLAALAPADEVLACSRTVAAAQAAIWPHRRTRAVHPGVELDGPAVTSAAARRALLVGVPEAAPVIGIVGRLQRWKGMHVLIDALPMILERHPDAHVVIVGGDHPLEPGYRDELTAQTRRLGLADRVHLAGYQPRAVEWMQAFDVVVHASDNEPFGLVVLEAMALGKPLVAGSEGGPAEVVRDGIDGLLAPFGDANALAAAVNRYLDDPRLAAELGAAAAERAREFTPQRFAREVVGELATCARVGW